MHACARDALPPPSLSLWDNDQLWSGSVAYTGNYDSEYTGEVSLINAAGSRYARPRGYTYYPGMLDVTSGTF